MRHRYSFIQSGESPLTYPSEPEPWPWKDWTNKNQIYHLLLEVGSLPVPDNHSDKFTPQIFIREAYCDPLATFAISNALLWHSTPWMQNTGVSAQVEWPGGAMIISSCARIIDHQHQSSHVNQRRRSRSRVAIKLWHALHFIFIFFLEPTTEPVHILFPATTYHGVGNTCTSSFAFHQRLLSDSQHRCGFHPLS